MNTAAQQIPRLNLRQRRAESMAAAIMQALDDFLPRRNRREIHDALGVMLMTEGVEVLTDWDREQAGLPPRGPDGWTIEELVALEQKKMEALTRPMSAIILNK